MYRSPADPDHTGDGNASVGAAALAHDQIIDAPGVPRFSWRIMRDQLSGQFATLDLTPDLGCDIGSKRWLRGFGTFLGLGAVALAFWPNFAPLEAAPAAHLDDAVRDEYRAQMIMPLRSERTAVGAWGTALVAPLAAAERPTLWSSSGRRPERSSSSRGGAR